MLPIIIVIIIQDEFSGVETLSRVCEICHHLYSCDVTMTYVKTTQRLGLLIEALVKIMP